MSVLFFFHQLKAKRSECNSKANHARNDYLLTLAAANAHQQRYYDTDLINCIKVRCQHTHVRAFQVIFLFAVMLHISDDCYVIVCMTAETDNLEHHHQCASERDAGLLLHYWSITS